MASSYFWAPPNDGKLLLKLAIPDAASYFPSLLLRVSMQALSATNKPRETNDCVQVFGKGRSLARSPVVWCAFSFRVSGREVLLTGSLNFPSVMGKTASPGRGGAGGGAALYKRKLSRNKSPRNRYSSQACVSAAAPPCSAPWVGVKGGEWGTRGQPRGPELSESGCFPCVLFKCHPSCWSRCTGPLLSSARAFVWLRTEPVPWCPPPPVLAWDTPLVPVRN